MNKLLKIYVESMFDNDKHKLLRAKIILHKYGNNTLLRYKFYLRTSNSIIFLVNYKIYIKQNL